MTGVHKWSEIKHKSSPEARAKAFKKLKKAINRKAKGRRAEYKSKKLLEAQGYRVIRSAASLGSFDLVAFSKRDTLLIQVKCGTAKVSTGERDEMEKFPSGPFCIKVIHHWPDRAKEPVEEFLNSHVEEEMHPQVEIRPSGRHSSCCHCGDCP